MPLGTWEVAAVPTSSAWTEYVVTVYLVLLLQDERLYRGLSGCTQTSVNRTVHIDSSRRPFLQSFFPFFPLQ